MFTGCGYGLSHCHEDHPDPVHDVQEIRIDWQRQNTNGKELAVGGISGY
jgi:hypothetical protein